MIFISRLTYLSTILVLLIFQCTTDIYSSNYYVDGDLKTGNNNGSSWNNAWQSFSAINWNLIQPGDVVYISGGTDSIVYYERLNIQTSGSDGNYVTIRNAVDPGHNGRVIIDGDSTLGTGIYIGGYGSNNYNGYWTYIKGFEVRHFLIIAVHLHYHPHNVVIDSCYIYENSGGHLILQGDAGNATDLTNVDPSTFISDVEIKNCRVISWKDYSGSNPDDLIGVNRAQNININNNFLWMRNIQSQSQPPNHNHVDPIQTLSTRSLKIWNNIAIVDSGAWGHCMILGVQSRPGGLDTNIVYNNYMYEGGHLLPNGNPSVQQLYLRWYGFGVSVYPPTFVYHNTIVGANGATWAINHERPAWVKNNIMIEMGTNGQDPANYGGAGRTPWYSGWNSSWYTEADNCTNNLIWSAYGGQLFSGNRFMGSGGSPVGTPSGWSAWTNTYGGNGVNANPQFINNVRNPDGYIIGSNSPAINAGGIDVEAFIKSKGLPWADIEGNPRPSGTAPTIGAYELVSTPVELTSFTVISQFGKILLNWVTVTETNNLGFEIERKQDDSEWERVGFVEGNGTTLKPNEYSYIDDISTLQVTSIVYRLKQIDFDGSFEYSEAVEVQTMPVHFELSQNYPNPFNPYTTIGFLLPRQTQLKINIYNMLGELVETLADGTYNAGYHNVIFNSSNLPSGAYIYRIESDAFVQAKKMILLK